MHLLLSAAFVLCWSSGFIGAKLGADSAPAGTLLMWRFLPLAAVLVVVAALSARAAWRGLTARDLARQAVIGALSQSGYLLTVYSAIQLGVSSGTTALIDGTQPLVAGALAGPLLHQYVSRRQWLGLGLGVGGVIVVTTADAAAGSGVAGWAYLVPFLGMSSLVAATFLENRSRTRVAPSVSMTIHCTTSAVLFTALAAGTGSLQPPASLSFWVAVGWLVVLSTFGGYGLYWLILRRRGVTEVNTLMFLMAPVTALWGAAMFGEPFGPQTAAGLALGLAAVAVVHRGAARPAGADTTASPPPCARGRTSGHPLVRPRDGDRRLRGVGRPGR
ncbi:DMT family transporter [Streptomyces sp. MCA2]|uniref:DMT family transporter n=1 Tax=Streptomyces sp. MCA2 TaxID=2944805 RepID=UPI0020206BE3|nr:DMT family transporter [Streptomyces sp. MCA2]MCL7494041.1 DMT family transporter [Streptomyces sp. MCA2]